MRKVLFSVAMLLAFIGPALAETYLYVADHNNGKVIKIKLDGTLVWDAPTVTATMSRCCPTRTS